MKMKSMNVSKLFYYILLNLNTRFKCTLKIMALDIFASIAIYMLGVGYFATDMDFCSDVTVFIILLRKKANPYNRQTVMTPPGCFAGSTKFMCEFMSFTKTFTKTSRTSTGRGEAMYLMVLHHWFADSVDLHVTTDCLVVRVNNNDFKEVVCRLLTDPI